MKSITQNYENNKKISSSIMKIFLITLTDKLSLTSEELDNILDVFLAALTKDLQWFLHLCS